MRLPFYPLIIAGLLLNSIASSTAQQESQNEFVTIKGNRFYDPSGRNIILRGINIGYSSRVDNEGHASAVWSHGGPEAFENIRAWGYNCVRLVLYWSAIEPECGEYNETFLKDLDTKVNWAKENDLYVILDMHQDLWGLGVPGARGAPEWTLVDKTQEHVKGEKVWSEAYFTSPLVQTAFDNFWNNQPGPDGVGIQDRFALVWKQLAERYANEAAVIGFDLLNEPFGGSPVREAFMAMTMQMLPKLLIEKPEDLRTDPVELAEAVMAFAESDFDLYKEWLAGGDSFIEELDRERVAPMYQRVAMAIREVDPHHILFTSTTICSNFGLQNGIQRIVDKEGNPDPHHAFSPHIYDDDIERIEYTYGRLVETSERMDTPLLIGEWGNLTNSDRIFQEDPIEPTKRLVELMDATQASDTYWYYMEDLDRQPYFESVLQRPYPMAVSGMIENYSFDPKTRKFVCEWTEEPGDEAENVFYLPPIWYEEGAQCEVVPPEPHIPAPAAGLFSLPASGGTSLTRKLIVTPKE